LLELLTKRDDSSSAPPEPASPLLPVNTCMGIAVHRESRELVELVLESYPVCIPKGYVLPAKAAEVCSSLGSPPPQGKAARVWAMDGRGEGLRSAEDAPVLHHRGLLCGFARLSLVSRYSSLLASTEPENPGIPRL